MKLKNILAAGIISALSFGCCLQANATANVAIEKAPLITQVNTAIMLSYSRPTFNILSLSLQDAKEIGYYFDAKNDYINMKQYFGTVGLAKVPTNNNTKLAMNDIVPFGVVVDDSDWEKFRSTILSVDVDNCLDCALYDKTKDVYKLKDHLVSLRTFTSMVTTLKARSNYAIKESAYNRLMQTDKKFADTRAKAQERGFKLCPVVPDDYPGMNLDSYVNRVQTHMNAVEGKMKAALQ